MNTSLQWSVREMSSSCCLCKELVSCVLIFLRFLLSSGGYMILEGAGVIHSVCFFFFVRKGCIAYKEH